MEVKILEDGNNYKRYNKQPDFDLTDICKKRYPSGQV
jgi:hypothetical protein